MLNFLGATCNARGSTNQRTFQRATALGPLPWRKTAARLSFSTAAPASKRSQMAPVGMLRRP
eukprot:2087683-Lingulodinium_polyedra.AAC.1